jgi:hypothetical protein
MLDLLLHAKLDHLSVNPGDLSPGSPGGAAPRHPHDPEDRAARAAASPAPAGAQPLPPAAVQV